MTTPKEVEIKLRLDPNKVRDFVESGRFAGVKSVEKHFHTVYFDDEKHHLFREGFELRVRGDGERYIRTLKSTDSVERSEWETEAADGHLSLEDLEAPGVEKFVKRGLALRAQFSLDVDRKTWDVAAGGSRIEVALDQGKLEAEGRQKQICEAELEL
ncbi:MAG TPA: CYTH domain-containing protein [Methylocystis sp.]|nr:CYTH domain-containing protein [Methylocystis sp.]